MSELDDSHSEPTEDNDSKGIGHNIKKHAAILIAALVLFLFYGRYGSTSFDNAVIWAGLIVSVNYGLQAMDMSFKYGSPQLICNLFHTATDGHYVPVGGYAIFKNNTIDAYMAHYSIGGGVTIVPEAAINHYGRNVALTVRVQPKAKEELAPEVLETIRKNNIDGPYYEGLIDDNLTTYFPEVKFVVNELNQLRKHVNMLEGYIDGRSQTLEKIISHGRRLGDKSDKKGWATAVKDQVLPP